MTTYTQDIKYKAERTRNMTMKEYYKMGIRDAIELRKKVENLGRYLREEFVPEYNRYASVYKYIGNVYYIDSRLDIIEIK